MDKYLCERCGKELVFRCAYSRIDHKLICVECDDKEQPKELMKQITYLEEKLAESEKESNARYKAWQEEICECDRLRVALAEKDAEVQSWKDGTMVVKLGKLEKQLAEKEKEIEELKKGVYKVTLGTTPSNQIDFTENFYVIQNQTAIAELEKVKEFCQNSDGFNEHGQSIRVECVVDFIDCAIKDLKGEK